MGLPKQEYWSGLQFSSPGSLPRSGIEPMSPALAAGFFTTDPPGKPYAIIYLTFLFQWGLFPVTRIEHLQVPGGLWVACGRRDKWDSELALECCEDPPRGAARCVLMAVTLAGEGLNRVLRGRLQAGNRFYFFNITILLNQCS